MVRPFSLDILLRERGRYIPAIFAVAFSALLLTMQWGMLLGFMAVCSRPVQRAHADIWAGSGEAAALGFSHPIPESWWGRLASQPEVVRVAPYLYGFTLWHRPDHGIEQCYLIGSRLEPNEPGAVRDFDPEVRARLSRPGTVAVYGPDRSFLGLTEESGEAGEIAGQRVELVGTIAAGKHGAGLSPGLFCSLRTARELLPSVPRGQASYLLACCRDPEGAQRVVERLRHRYPDMSVFTTQEFAWRTQWYWLIKTRAGLVLAFAATLGLIIGTVITSQTLYAATMASQRELAMLIALGIPRWRISGLVLMQSFWVSLAGLVLAYPISQLCMNLGSKLGVVAMQPIWLHATVALIIIAMALMAGFYGLRSLRHAEPESLLR